MLQHLLEVADAHDVLVAWRALPSWAGGGMCVWRGSVATIVLDPELERGRQVEALAHELGHVLAGVPAQTCVESLERVLRARRELAADRTVTRLVVDLEAVAAVIAIVEDLGGHVTAEVIAGDLEVPVRYARIALEQLSEHRAAGQVSSSPR